MTEINYAIIGSDLQAIILKLKPNQSVVAEPGAMMYMMNGIELETTLGNPKKNSGLMDKLFQAGKRVLTGESLFVNTFQNKTNDFLEIAFAAPYPGKIIPISLENFDGEITCQKDAFLCGVEGIEINIVFTKRLGAGFFGGEGFIMQKVSGQGQAFLHAGGSIHEMTLQAEQTLKVDTGCLVALEKTVEYDIEMVKGFKSVLFGGEGLFYATLKGPGKIYLQTLPFSRLADRIIAASPRNGGTNVGEGSLLGSLGNLIDGD